MEIEPGLYIAASVTGMAALSQVVHRRLHIPVPVFLLLAGMLLGEEALGVVSPSETPQLASVVVTLAVALIVFEGGMSLSWRMLRMLASPVRNLVVLALIITPIVGALSAHYFLDFGWRVSVLFGALVCVTGPSVIAPLLRGIRVNDQIHATLMGEGIIIDPFGALLTLFLLQIAVAESFDPAGPVAWVVTRVTVGLAIGAGAALAVALGLRVVRRLTSREVGLMVVAAAVVAFAIAEGVAREAGLTAMVVMGIALGNIAIPHRSAVDDLLETFAAVLVASVYVLLAASVDLDALWALWPEGVWVVLALVLIGRPLVVFLSTLGSRLNWRERVFLGAVAPRGVVAASLASVVALQAGEHLGADEATLVAMVFAVILGTVTVQSAYAGPLSRLLHVYPMTTVIAGAGEVGRRLAAKLTAAGERVVLIEAEEETAVKAREEGFEVTIGDMADLALLRKAGVNQGRALLLTTPDDDRNLLVAQLARTELGCQRIYARLNNTSYVGAFTDLGVTVVNPSEATATELAAAFGEPELQDMLSPLDEDVTAARIRVTNPDAQREVQSLVALRGTVVPVIRRGARSLVPDGKTAIQLGDVVTVFGHASDLARVRQALTLEA